MLFKPVYQVSYYSRSHTIVDYLTCRWGEPMEQAGTQQLYRWSVLTLQFC